MGARTIKLAPSILAADFGRLTEQVQELERSGLVDRIHVDVMDGLFVPNLSFGPMIVQVVRKATRLPLDVHLMIVEPGRYLTVYADSGANYLTIHVEACPHLAKDLAEIRRIGCKAGVAINPGTTPVLIDSVLDLLDVVLVMSVNPGFGGQKFIPSAVPKISRVCQMLESAGVTAEISVDGGVAPATAPRVVTAGASVLVAGSAVFHHQGGVAAALKELQAAADSVERSS